MGFRPKKLHYYRLALTHRSALASETKGNKKSNERLEFLGDAVLGAIVAELVFTQFPAQEEGFLSEMRSKMVNRSYLNTLAEKMGLAKLIIHDPKLFQGKGPTGSILGDTLEALLGAIYLDKGFDITFSFYKTRIFDLFLDLEQLARSQINYKSKILEWGQRQGKEITFDSTGPEPKAIPKYFTVRILVDGIELGIGKGLNKKNAEKMASEKACQKLKI